MAHRDLYYLNRFRSKATPHEVLTIMHDKMDHSKTASLTLFLKIKHLVGLMKLPLALTGMPAHGHVDHCYALSRLDIYSHNANYTIGSFAKLLRVLESLPKSTSKKLFQEDPSHPPYVVLVNGSQMCLDPLGPPSKVVVTAKPLPPILNVQRDNVVNNNENNFFSHSSLYY